MSDNFHGMQNPREPGNLSRVSNPDNVWGVGGGVKREIS